MGCASSSPASEPPPAKEEPKAAAPEAPAKEPPKDEKARPESLKVNDIDVTEVKEKRLSIHFVAQEIDQKSAASSNNLTSTEEPTFDRKQIGTSTKHGVMPAPRGGSLAKINQDRGVICFPFHGSFDEALLCVFDGHGPKGEKASEFCIKTIPELLEKDHDLLMADPEASLVKNVVELDNILKNGPLARITQSCGTTSNVLYFSGNTVHVASSGDSRAIMGSRKNGKIVATDLSDDHKPDLPIERARIEKAGGVVAPSGPGGRPARVWADGRVGLAMSRSIGDFECKRFGVIPDPEVKKYELKPAEGDGDGDLFIIVASDGVWEFIESQEAATIVAAISDSTKACEKLVSESAERWRRFEGTYRDDITCIMARLPFLGRVGDQPAETADVHGFQINAGASGISRLDSGEMSPEMSRKGKPFKGEEGDKSDEDIIHRRLSVTNPYGDDGDEEWEDAPDDERTA